MTERRKLVYIASPISKGDLVENICKAHSAGIHLVKEGLSVIVPHGTCFWGNMIRITSNVPTSFHPEVLPHGTFHEDWYGMDLEIVRRCDAVLRLPGESTGADLEVQEAVKNKIPVFYSIEEVTLWMKCQNEKEVKDVF